VITVKSTRPIGIKILPLIVVCQHIGWQKFQTDWAVTNWENQWWKWGFSAHFTKAGNAGKVNKIKRVGYYSIACEVLFQMTYSTCHFFHTCGQQMLPQVTYFAVVPETLEFFFWGTVCLQANTFGSFIANTNPYQWKKIHSIPWHGRDHFRSHRRGLPRKLIMTDCRKVVIGSLGNKGRYWYEYNCRSCLLSLLRVSPFLISLLLNLLVSSILFLKFTWVRSIISAPENTLMKCRATSSPCRTWREDLNTPTVNI